MKEKFVDTSNGYGRIPTLSIQICVAFDMDQER
jgi:hypothetical protein